MSALAANAKAITAAIMTLLIAGLRVYWPDITDGAVQEALRVLVEVGVSALLVWLIPNAPKEPNA